MAGSQLQFSSKSSTTGANPHQEMNPGEQPKCREEHCSTRTDTTSSQDVMLWVWILLGTEREAGVEQRWRPGDLAPQAIPAQSSRTSQCLPPQTNYPCTPKSISSNWPQHSFLRLILALQTLYKRSKEDKATGRLLHPLRHKVSCGIHLNAGEAQQNI